MEKTGIYKKYIAPVIHHKVFTLFLIFVVMVIIFSIWSALRGTSFLRFAVFRNILNSLVVTSFLAIGAGFLLVGGKIDLSQAAVGAFGGVVLAAAIGRWGMPWYVGVIIALALCAVLGAINALMITKFRIPFFIATLAMTLMAQGLMYLFSSIGNNGVASNINFQDKTLRFIGTGTIGPIPVGIIIMVIFFVVYGIILSKTSFGMKVKFVGGNPVAAGLAGISATAIAYILFINSAVLSGVAGILTAARLGQGSLMALQTNQFTGITAAVLGGISFGGGVGGMAGVFVGLLILNTFQIGMGAVGVNPFWVQVFTGALLLIALTVDFITQKRSSAAQTTL
ncbi:MAG: ABC transporter permease [Firmicutes bacterium]|nr:ABC transporter permease [Bacillota bacterium]